MARIMIEDLKVPEQTLSAKEMEQVVGGWGWRRRWTPPPYQEWRVGQQTRFSTRTRWIQQTYQVRQNRDVYRNNYGGFRFGQWIG